MGSKISTVAIDLLAKKHGVTVKLLNELELESFNEYGPCLALEMLAGADLNCVYVGNVLLERLLKLDTRAELPDKLDNYYMGRRRFIVRGDGLIAVPNYPRPG